MSDNITDDLELLVSFEYETNAGDTVTRSIHRLSYDLYIVTTEENGEEIEEALDADEVYKAFLEGSNNPQRAGTWLKRMTSIDFYSNPNPVKTVQGIECLFTGVAEIHITATKDPRKFYPDYHLHKTARTLPTSDSLTRRNFMLFPNPLED